MYGILVPFLLRHTATTTIVSTITVLISLYKFKLKSCGRPSRPSFKGRAQRKGITALIRRNKLDLSPTRPDIQDLISTLFTAGHWTIINQVSGLRLEVKLRDWQKVIQRARKFLQALDAWLDLMQYKMMLLEARITGRQPDGIETKQRIQKPTKRKLWVDFRRAGNCRG